VGLRGAGTQRPQDSRRGRARGRQQRRLSVVETAEKEALFLEADGEETISADLLGADALDAAALMPSERGETTETTVTSASSSACSTRRTW